ncbi:MAG: hypothetical protein ABEH80_06240 [Halobaculum sp.]
MVDGHRHERGDSQHDRERHIQPDAPCDDCTTGVVLFDGPLDIVGVVGTTPIVVRGVLW